MSEKRLSPVDWRFASYRLRATIDTTPRLYLRELLTIIFLLLVFIAFAAKIIVSGG